MVAALYETREILELPVTGLHPHPKNPIHRVDDLDDILPSIRRVGVLEPILVRSDGAEWEIIAGVRRHAAAVEAGLMFVPCIVRDDLDERARVEARAIENLARKDYHPLDAAAVLQELVDLGALQSEIAELLGYDPGEGQPFVSRRLALLRLPDEVQTAFRAGHLTVKQAETISTLHDAPAALEKAVEIVVGTLDGTLDDWKIKQVADEGRREKQRVAALAELAAAGALVVSEEEWEGDAAAGWFVLSDEGEHADTNEIGVDAATHITEPCHVAFIDDYGLVEHGCTNPDRHRPAGESEVKAPNLTDDPAIGAVDKELAKTNPKEAARQAKWKADEKERKERARVERARFEARAEAGRTIIATTRSKTVALDLLVDRILRDGLASHWYDEVVAVLGIEPIRGYDQRARGEQLRSWVAGGGDEHIIRFALAAVFAIGDDHLECVTRIRDQWSMKLTDQERDNARAHLQLLEHHGYKPTDHELASLEPEAGKPAEDKKTKGTARKATSKKAAAPAAEATPIDSLDRGLCSCGTDTALRKGGLYREHNTPAGDKCEHSGKAHAATKPGAADRPDTTTTATEAEPATYKLSRPRLAALKVLAFADATGAGKVSRSSYSTSKFEGADVELVVMGQIATWLVDNGLADSTQSTASGARQNSYWLTDEGRRVALEEEVLAGLDLPDPVPVVPVTPEAIADADADAELGAAAAAPAADAVVDDVVDRLWALYETAREAASAKKASTSTVAEYVKAKHELIDGLVSRHPDVFALTAGLAANLDGARNGAKFEDVVDDVLFLLAQGGPLPSAVWQQARLGDEIVLDPKPKKPVFRVFVEELLAASEARKA